MTPASKKLVAAPEGQLGMGGGQIMATCGSGSGGAPASDCACESGAVKMQLCPGEGEGKR